VITDRFAQRHYRLTQTVGSTLLEVISALGITGLVLGLSAMGIKRTLTDVGVSAQAVANDVRKARTYAVTRGAHYRIVLSSAWYRTDRLQDSNNDGVWEPQQGGTAAPQVNLASGVTMFPNTGNSTGSGSGTAGVIEFDSRGMVVPSPGGTVPGIMTLTIKGPEATGGGHGAGTLYVYVWPSGQVELLRSWEVHP
jgi:Tfp pilus assembly protein FimT